MLTSVGERRPKVASIDPEQAPYAVVRAPPSPSTAPPTQEPTSIFPPTTATAGILPVTGSSDARPTLLLALLLVPIGAGLVVAPAFAGDSLRSERLGVGGLPGSGGRDGGAAA